MASITTLSLFHWNSTNQDVHVVMTSFENVSLATFVDSGNSTLLPMDCALLQSADFIPWNNPKNVVTSEVEETVRKILNLLFLPVLFLIGCPANIINMVVFYKHGLKERINICLFALSLADELHLVFNMFFLGEQIPLHFTSKEMLGEVSRFIARNNLIGFYGFIWISQVISAIIASERCFCILQPLRSQNVLRTSTMIAIIVSTYFVILGLFFVVGTRYHIACIHDPSSGSSDMRFVPSEFYYRHRKLIDSLDVTFFGTALPGLVIVVVITTTIITTVKLRQATAWRAGASSNSNCNNLSQRDIALTKMLVSNSVFFIVCVIPYCVLRSFIFAMPEVNPGRRKHNLHMMFMWILIMFSYVNASFNFVIYYTMGSRYRQTIQQLVSCSGRARKIFA